MNINQWLKCVTMVIMKLLNLNVRSSIFDTQWIKIFCLQIYHWSIYMRLFYKNSVIIIVRAKIFTLSKHKTFWHKMLLSAVDNKKLAYWIANMRNAKDECAFLVYSAVSIWFEHIRNYVYRSISISWTDYWLFDHWCSLPYE